MKQLLRILLAAVGIVAIIGVAAVVYVTTFLDPEDFKPRLIEVVEEQTGLNLALDGPITWSFYPRIGVGVSQARAWLPEQTEEQTPFVAIDKAEVSVAFAPLLRGEIAVDGLTLDGMRLNLERDAEGQGNWTSLTERLAEQGDEAEAVLAPASAGPHVDAGNLSVVLNIASVDVRNTDIRFRDALENAFWHVKQLNLSGSNVNAVRAFPLKVMFTVDKYNQLSAEALERAPGVTSEINLDTRMRLGLSEHRFTLENTNLVTRTQLAGSDAPQQLTFKASELIARLGEQQLTINDGVLEAGLRHPENWQGSLALSLAFALEGDLEAGTAQLRNLQLTGPDNLRLSGHLNLDQLTSAPHYSGQVTAAPFNMRPWLSRLGAELKTANEAALSDVALTSPIEGDLERLALPSLSLVVDDSTFTGALDFRFDGDALNFDLEGDSLDLDRYLPGRETAQQASRTGLLRKAFAQNAGENELLPQAWLSRAQINGDLAIVSLVLGGLDFDSARMSLRGEEGIQRLSAFEAGFYEGDISATGAIDARENVLDWQLTPSIERVQVAPLLEAISGDTAPLRGRFNMTGELVSQGNTRSALLGNLNGELDARVNDGAIFDINVSREMCEIVAQLEGEEVRRDWHTDTRFERFDATFAIRNGVVTSDDLTIELPGIAVAGDGEFDLNQMIFDTRASARVVDTADAACAVNPRLEQLPLPVRCEGAVSEARDQWCHFDREAFQSSLVGLLRSEAGSRAGEALDEQLGGALDRLDEHLGEGVGQELRDGIQRLFD